MSYVYWKSEPHLWTVGYYTPDGERETDSDHSSPDEAAKRVHYLNGGNEPEIELNLKEHAGYRQKKIVFRLGGGVWLKNFSFLSKKGEARG